MAAKLVDSLAVKLYCYPDICSSPHQQNGLSECYQHPPSPNQSCGLRASEVAGVNVDDFSSSDTLRVLGKGRKERLVPVGKMARLAIAEWLPLRKEFLAEKELETPALLFSVGPRESVERLDVRSIHRVVRRVAVAKGLPQYHPHQLRHACATHMHDHGAPIQAVAAMLGHARLSTAQIYTRVSPVRMLNVYRKAHPHATRSESC